MIISKNAQYRSRLKLSPWRKIAFGTWNTVGDPSVYGLVDLEVESALRYMAEQQQLSGEKITMTHFFGALMGKVIEKHPQINATLRLGGIYQRENIDIFFQAATDNQGEDLSGLTVRNINQKNIVEIAKEMNVRVAKIKNRTDTSYTKMKGLIGIVPTFLVKCILNASSFLMYTLNLWSPLLGAPRDTFGSCMITNIGALGLETAFAPLVPYSRCPMVFALGNVSDKPVVKNGAIVIAKLCRITVTFDHRLIDGVHATTI
jgi:pyruvate dehydrogenase E2 component (dihydrolipoamide acetyltransferase)